MKLLNFGTLCCLGFLWASSQAFQDFKVMYYNEKPPKKVPTCSEGFVNAFSNQARFQGDKVTIIRNDSNTYAVKSVSTSLTQDGILPLEVSLLAQLKYQGIAPDVTCSFQIQNRTHSFYAMKFIPGTTTLENTEAFYNPTSDNIFERWANLSISLATLVQKVHDHKIVHLNIQRKNFIITPKGRLHIVGFSQARQLNYLQNLPSQAVVIPEVQVDSHHYTFKSDMYLLGKVLGELFISMRRLLLDNVSKTRDWWLIDFYSQHLNQFPVKIIERLASEDPRKRMTTEQLIENLQKYRDEYAGFPIPFFFGKSYSAFASITKAKQAILVYLQHLHLTKPDSAKN